jgi:hypothetical protein
MTRVLEDTLKQFLLLRRYDSSFIFLSRCLAVRAFDVPLPTFGQDLPKAEDGDATLRIHLVYPEYFVMVCLG